jgi:hypothetical protein
VPRGPAGVDVTFCEIRLPAGCRLSSLSARVVGGMTPAKSNCRQDGGVTNDPGKERNELQVRLIDSVKWLVGESRHCREVFEKCPST